MINEKPQWGTTLIDVDGKATPELQNFFDAIEEFAKIITTEPYTVANAPDAAGFPNGFIFVSDETGGATMAFSDGTDWRRVQDRAVIS